MPLIDGKYVSPVWVNGGAPALDALELQGITDTVQNTQAALGDYQGPFAKLGLTGDPTIGGSLGVLADIGNLHVWKRTVGSAVDYLVSTNRNAYTDGTSGGTTINYVGVFGDKARVQVVEYVGTGTYGLNQYNSATFDFTPKVIQICPINIPIERMAIWFYNSTYFFAGYYANSDYRNNAKATWHEDLKRLDWSSNQGATHQLNALNVKYKIIALA